MKYERVEIGGEYYFRVPEHDVNAFICDKCHFYYTDGETQGCSFPPEIINPGCYTDENPILYLFMTQSELARENIRKRKEKQRNAQE
jgi:hypothetical protein